VTFEHHIITEGEKRGDDSAEDHSHQYDLRDPLPGAVAETELQFFLSRLAQDLVEPEEEPEIPPGETTSYGAIATALHSPGASRAVGAANGANPVSIIVPCHRVIGASGSLTGYGGGLERKTWLIDHERRWRREPQPSLF